MSLSVGSYHQAPRCLCGAHNTCVERAPCRAVGTVAAPEHTHVLWVYTSQIFDLSLVILENSIYTLDIDTLVRLRGSSPEMYEWPKGASGTAWEGGPSSGTAGSGAAGRAAGLRAQTTGGPEADGAARARRQAELRKARVLAAGGERMKQVSGQGGAAGSARDGRQRRKKRANMAT